MRAPIPNRPPEAKGEGQTKWLGDLFRWGLALARRTAGRTILECSGSVRHEELIRGDVSLAINSDGDKLIFTVKGRDGKVKTAELELE